jgi:CRP-like cAMP-binding protein
MLKLLKKVPLFAGMSDEIVGQIAGLTSLRVYSPGEYLCRRGDVGDELFIIRQGQVKIVLTSFEGREIILALLKEGDFLGELSLIDGEPRSADAIAVENTEVIIIGKSCFEKLLRDNEQLRNEILRVLARRLRQANENLLDSFLPLLLKVTKRIVLLAEKFARHEGFEDSVEISLSQQQLADMIGASREAVNRCLKVLRDHEVIDWRKKRLKVTDLKGLKALLLSGDI